MRPTTKIVRFKPGAGQSPAPGTKLVRVDLKTADMLTNLGLLPATVQGRISQLVEFYVYLLKHAHPSHLSQSNLEHRRKLEHEARLERREQRRSNIGKPVITIDRDDRPGA
jgi:hypothetical protein